MCDQGLIVGLCVQDYKSLCTAVTTYAPWLSQNLIPTFWPVTLKSRSNPRLLCIHVRCTHDADLWLHVCRFQRYCTYLDCLKTDESRAGWSTFLPAIMVRSWVSACKIISVCVHWLRFVPPCSSQNLICPFWPLWSWKVGRTPGIYCTHVGYTHDPNLVTAGQQVAEIMQI